MRRPSRAHRASSRRNACHGIDRRANQSFDPAGEALHSRRFSTEPERPLRSGHRPYSWQANYPTCAHCKGRTFDIAGLRAIIYDVDNLAQFRAELSRTIDATFGQDRLDEARCLIESGMYRAAVALLGIVLEHDLRFVIERNNIGLTGRIGPRPLTIAQSLRALGVAGLLGTADEKALRKAVGIRNRAVHEVKELSRDEALLMLDTVQDFRNRYVNPSQDRF